MVPSVWGSVDKKDDPYTVQQVIDILEISAWISADRNQGGGSCCAVM